MATSFTLLCMKDESDHLDDVSNGTLYIWNVRTVDIGLSGPPLRLGALSCLYWDSLLHEFKTVPRNLAALPVTDHF